MVSYKNKEIKRHEDSLKKWMGNTKPVRKEEQSQMKDEGVPVQKRDLSNRVRCSVSKFGFNLVRGE